MMDAVQDNCILTVINLSKSKRNLFIQKNVKHLNMNLIHGIVYSAFFPNKECRKLFQYDAFHKELRLLSCSIPDKSFLAKELGIHEKDIHTYNYMKRLDSMCDGELFSFSLVGNPVVKSDNKKLPIKDKDACINWFVRKANKMGFSIKNIDVSYPRPYMCKNDITFNTVLFQGTLEIEDKMSFKDTIMNGIGRGKGFGFGMLWVT